MIVPLRTYTGASSSLGVLSSTQFKKIPKGRSETAVGDEGGFAPRFDGIKDGVETIIAAIEALFQVKTY